MGSTEQLCAVRIRHTHTIHVNVNTEAIYITIYGISIRKLPIFTYTTGIEVVEIPDFEEPNPQFRKSPSVYLSSNLELERYSTTMHAHSHYALPSPCVLQRTREIITPTSTQYFGKHVLDLLLLLILKLLHIFPPTMWSLQ